MAGDAVDGYIASMTEEEQRVIAELLARLDPPELTVQEVQPGVYAYCWRWHPDSEEGGGDGG